MKNETKYAEKMEQLQLAEEYDLTKNTMISFKHESIRIMNRNLFKYLNKKTVYLIIKTHSLRKLIYIILKIYPKRIYLIKQLDFL